LGAGIVAVTRLLRSVGQLHGPRCGVAPRLSEQIVPERNDEEPLID
jgi:hypothetical protein